ncbi:M23 family metallopeptidase [Desulfurivibrio alkaliphilus]|uniref:Peptidase M23 n=1 Tax=Desulfurivibrio alkaliphilus (strain DSM 19089 / UNIQEM U267 / AHT2) TaxID=589865 RepID=D6Z3A9_DESAT|nr:M23 family metallopeptidase [Desulfurivibrio alkaliphilus]ADH86034.1 Peptidase M23 [Desulfurivibrio alkaliphilus AHT 2]
MSLEPIQKREKKSAFPWRFWLLVVAAAILVPVLVILVRLHEGNPPRLGLDPEVAWVGQHNEFAVLAADERSGLRSVEVLLRQGGREVGLLKREFPRASAFFRAGPEEFREVVEVVGRELNLREGEAELVLKAGDYSWRNWGSGNYREEIYPVVIDTRPPVINVGAATRYVRAGGAGVVRYTIDEEVVKHGVEINGFFHPGFPLADDRSGEYLAYIGLPHDTTSLDQAQVVAVDRAGNQARAGLGINLRQVEYSTGRINVSDSFLRSKLPEFVTHYPELSGSYLEQYLYVNRRVREMNDRRIMEICRDSHPQRLWEGRFLRMARSSEQAGFGDHRSYFYDGRKIDEQTHLGIDLASVRQAEIQAANHGIVVFAEYLGIYGNTVIIDHGQGIFSLYSHLSRITTEVGERVARGDQLGYSGVTGMAGGDHLHFSMLVNGIFVNPIEWWDRNWVENQLTVEP